jgi:hypothetical protein
MGVLSSDSPVERTALEAAVFQYEGEEHVVVYSAGNLFASSPRGDSVWLFSLNGTMEQATSPSLSK